MGDWPMALEDIGCFVGFGRAMPGAPYAWQGRLPVCARRSDPRLLPMSRTGWMLC